MAEMASGCSNTKLQTSGIRGPCIAKLDASEVDDRSDKVISIQVSTWLGSQDPCIMRRIAKTIAANVLRQLGTVLK
jgi:hypothetical protein